VRHVFRYLVRTVPGPGETLALSDADTHHLVKVVRRRAGDGVELIDPEGQLWPATVVDAGPPARVRVAAAAELGPPAAPVVLYQGLAEWGRVDMLVEKAAELGVSEVVLFASERARRVPAPDAWRRRRERLGRVVEAAARQAGRGNLTRVRGLLALDAVLAEIPQGTGFLLDARGERSLSAALAGTTARPGAVRVVVGPDTGFAENEVRAAREAGLAVCRLGAGTLRAETAALVALSLALQAAGALGDGDRAGGAAGG
jgi:16S rRNA (uracil1498-N3)-methyltransferase